MNIQTYSFTVRLIRIVITVICPRNIGRALTVFLFCSLTEVNAVKMEWLRLSSTLTNDATMKKSFKSYIYVDLG